VHLYRYYSTQNKPLREVEGGLPKHKLKLVLDYIHDYLDQDLSLADLAALVEMSPHYFARLFKQSTGFTPHQYVIRTRVERAKQLLLQGKLTIAQIAYSVGFAHQSHLNRHFKRHLGLTPKTLLKK
jgi:AraC family transcriptional regulator